MTDAEHIARLQKLLAELSGKYEALTLQAEADRAAMLDVQAAAQQMGANSVAMAALLDRMDGSQPGMH